MDKGQKGLIGNQGAAGEKGQKGTIGNPKSVKRYNRLKVPVEILKVKKEILVHKCGEKGQRERLKLAKSWQPRTHR